MSTPSYNTYKMVPMIMIMGTIFFLSHQRGDAIVLPAFSNSDLVAHTIAYTALAWTILYAWSERYKTLYPLQVVLWTVFFCFVYGLSDEFHQSFIPGRQVSGLDVLADTIGGILMCYVWYFVKKSSKNTFIYRFIYRFMP